MRRFLFVLFLLPVMAWAGKNTPARKLVSLLTECKAREELVPDSFFSDVLRLKQEIAEQQDSVAKAVYSATLAHLLMQNEMLAQSATRETASHPDSVKEWSREEYLQEASRLYAYALHDMELLHRTPTKEWIPLVNRGKDEKVYGSSMLAVVWQAMNSDIPYRTRKSNYLPLYAPLIQFYKEHALREAAFRLCMDSVFEMSRPKQEEYLLQLKDEYRDLPSCDRVYCELTQFKIGPEERRKIIEEGLLLYPNSVQLKNWISEQEAPSLQCSVNEYMYPEAEEKVTMFVKNIESVTLTLYHLPDDFQTNTEEELLPQILCQGKLFRKDVDTLAPHPYYTYFEHTMHLQAPPLGIYAMVMEGQTKARLEKKQEPQVHIFYVSKLRAFKVSLPNKKMQLVVVDGKEGRPEPGVSVKVKQVRNQEETAYTEYITDEWGRIVIDAPSARIHQRVKLSKGEDQMLPETELNGSAFYQPYTNANSKSNPTLNVYTDRSIYRPGQMVYVGAVAYQQQGREASVDSETSFTVTFYDNKSNKLAEHQMKTDEFGVFNDSIRLPKNAIPGNYSIWVGNTRCSFRVEEYRRPVFHAEIDPAQAVPFPADTIWTTGRAMTYSGAPVANARVTGKATFHAGFWRRRGPTLASLQLDTLYTDAEGRFSVPVSLALQKENNLNECFLHLQLDVLSRQGETEQAERIIRLTPHSYVLHCDMPGRQNKDQLEPFCFELYSNTMAPAEGDIVCRVIEGKKTEIVRFTVPANRFVTPSELKDVPSGSYSLVAEYVNGKDTIQQKFSLELFSLSDTRLVGKHDIVLFTPCDTFAVGRPAKMQIGTSLKKAWIYCTMLHHDKICLDTLLCVRDTAFVWEIPYKEEYGDGVSINAALYHEGLRTNNRVLHLAAPEKKLTTRWETFRDRLRPGQHEEWRLSLRRADGSPAKANVLLSMYDASLDAIRPHTMNLRVNYKQTVPTLPASTLTEQHRPRYYFYFPVKMLKVKDWQFSQYNPDYIYNVFATQQLAVAPTSADLKGGRIMRLRGTGNAKTLNSVEEERVFDFVGEPPLFSRAKVMNQASESVDADLEGHIAGLDMDDSVLPDAEVRGLRDNTFSELAFFRPTLRTDANGEVKISFTLPESLTSWHLLGFAHTTDLHTAAIDDTIVARKELMADLYLPRFLRSGDEAFFTAGIRNMSERMQQGKATCLIMDAGTEKVLSRFRVQFCLETGKDTVYTFPFGELQQHAALLVKWVAEGTGFSDGEQRQLPILSDLETVTETRAFSLDKQGTAEIPLEGLFANNHTSAANRVLTVEYTARPAWMALKALPALFTPRSGNVLNLSSAYYATTMAQHILRQVPNADFLVDSLQYGDILSLDHRMSLLSSLAALQQYDGGFVWFPGMKGNAYLTREVAFQLVRLRNVGVSTDAASVVAERMLQQAVRYLAKETHRQVLWMQNEKVTTVGIPTLRYLYILCHSNYNLSDENRKDEKYLTSCLLHPSADKKMDVEEAAITAVVLKRYGYEKEAVACLSKINKRLTHPDGYYISYPSGSFTSIDRKVQTHVQVMEAFWEVLPSEETLLHGLTEWLLQQKRTQQWDEPVKTVNAVYALLQDDTQPLAKSNSDVLKLCEGKTTHTMVTPHSSVGYLRDSLSVSTPTELRVEKHGNGLSWGALYATYQMPLDSVRASWQGFHIRRDVSSLQPKVGDRLHVRYTITADRDYDFVQLIAPRFASAEPEASLSGYGYQNGLGYYRMIRDDHTEYYFETMPKGTYVIEEDWFISHEGNYQTGPAVIRCLYAPEYQSFTSSERVFVK